MVKLKDVYPLYLNNEAQQPNADLEVTDKFTGEVAFRVAQADAATIDAGIAGAVEAAEPMARMASFERRAVLEHCVERFEQRFEELAYALCVEAGKPIKYARGEVDRLIDTVEIAAEESTRLYGEVLPLDISPRADGYQGMWRRVPVGACSFITPWNFPLNLVAHKLAPALACGCPFVLKPATTTPMSLSMFSACGPERRLLPIRISSRSTSRQSRSRNVSRPASRRSASAWPSSSRSDFLVIGRPPSPATTS